MTGREATSWKEEFISSSHLWPANNAALVFLRPPPLNDIVGKFDFRRDVLFFSSTKVVDIPHQEEKNDLFCGIFPHFLNSPTIS